MDRAREKRWCRVYARIITRDGVDSLRAVRLVAWAARSHPRLAQLLRLTRFAVAEFNAQIRRGGS